MTSSTTTVCIAGGGPAGMMCGVLLARAGVPVVVLEKHGDFLRDFRGDTVHPSTLEVMHELGWLDAFLRRPHQRVTQIGGMVGGERVTIADFSHLPTVCQFVAFMPQWEFLAFLAERGRRYGTFTLRMEAEALDLVDEDGTIAGVRGQGPEGGFEIRSRLVIGADGRQSVIRERAGLAVEDRGAPIDVLWMRIPRVADEQHETLGYLRNGHALVLLDRGDYWQAAFVIPKGGYDDVRARGLDALRSAIGAMVPRLAGRLDALASWDDVKLLTVKVDYLKQWCRPGLLCIGDAAHAMSPIGGVGINLAVQDAVAAVNRLAAPLLDRTLDLSDLQAVQERRAFPTRATQRLQILIQDRVLSRALAGGPPTSLPLLARLVRDHPMLRRLPARMIGLGFRPEHVAAGPGPGVRDPEPGGQ